MKLILTIALMIAVSGCAMPAAQPSTGHFTSIERFVYTVAMHYPTPAYSGEAKKQISRCVTSALVKDIPQSDQQVMLNAINNHDFTDENDVLFIKWFGRSMARGEIQHNYYGDGTPVNGFQTRVLNVGTASEYKEYLDLDGSVVSSTEPNVRAAQNAKQICPDLVAEYPEAFKLGPDYP